MGSQAIDAPRSNVFNVDANALTIIGLDTDDGVTHPLYDERIRLPLDESMVESIMTHGVKVPILVVKDGDAVVVVDGRQRVRHAREAAKRKRATVTVKAILEKGSFEDQALIGVLTNEQRQADSYAVRAIKAKRLMALGKTPKEVALAFGWTSTGPLTALLAFDGLDAEVKAAVDDGKLSMSAAAKLAPLPRDQQRSELAAALAESGGRVVGKDAMRERVRTIRTGDAQGAGAPSKALIRKIIAHAVDAGPDAAGLDPGFVRGLRWVVGDLKPGSIAGLNKAIRAVSKLATDDH